MPRFLLRRARVLHHLGSGKGRKVLDIGCGAGALLRDLSARGFDCTGLETSSRARQLAQAINGSCPATTILEEPRHDWAQRFDVVMAFEVLEHIHDDHAVLAQWCEWLKPGGTLIISVPCHMKKWSALDDWAGHVRRYEDDEIRRLITSNCLNVVSFEVYGFPLVSAISALRSRHYANALKARTEAGSHSTSQNTAESGIDRSDLLGFYRFCKTPLGIVMMIFAMQLQKVFLRSSHGDGFLIVARRNP